MTPETWQTQIRACAEERGCAVADLPRSAYLRWARRRYQPGERLTTRSMAALGGWDALKAAAAGAPPVDVSGLDFDDDQTDPMRVPLPAIPEGYFARSLSTLVDEDGATRLQWVKADVQQRERFELLMELVASLPERLPAMAPVEPPEGAGRDDLLAVYPMGDPHLGMLSWAPETGEAFNLKIAQQLTAAAMGDLVTRGPRTAEALIINLGDFFHSDNESNRTARSGHALDVDSRYAHVIQVGLELCAHLVRTALAHHDRVRVISAAGNHDDHSALWLAAALAAWFRDEPRVTVDTSPSRFYWHTFGANLIGVTHGHTIRRHEDLGAIMAAEQPEAWGATRHRWWLCGHLHHKRVFDLRGCTVEVFRTLAARDAWAANAGYRSRRDMARICLHREWGEMHRATASTDYLRAQYLAATEADAA